MRRRREIAAADGRARILVGHVLGRLRELPDRAYVTIRGKGDKTVRMLLQEGGLRAVDRWLEAAGRGDDPEAPLFTNLSRQPAHRERGSMTPEGVWHVVKTYFPGHSPHGLRARAITDVWLSSDGNLHMAQLFARHSSPTVTEQVYVQVEKLDRAMEFAPDYS